MSDRPDISFGPETGKDSLPAGGRWNSGPWGRLRSSRLASALAVALVLGAAAGGYLWWRHLQTYEATDNAYVHVTVVPVSARVSGMIQEVLVEDNQAVNKGDLIVRLDPALYQVALESAEAEVAMARARYESSRFSAAYSSGRLAPLVTEARARLARVVQTLRSEESFLKQRVNESLAAAASLARMRDELARRQKLHREKVISDDVLELALASFRVADAQHRASIDAQHVQEQKVAALKQQENELQASITLVQKEEISIQGKTADAESIEAQLKQAEAKLREARLRLSYTEIRAPEAGYVNKKAVEVGTNVEAGRPLMLIVPLHRVYVQANFKEVQLENIRVGQIAVVRADAYPNRRYRGRVESIFSGSGDYFSLLPAENATGNWVKVTKRIPVKIVLADPPSPQFPLLVGMSAQVSVDVRDQSGTRLLAYPSRVQKTTPGRQ
ncbi:MAG: HlyD family secretion protein [Candidatus Tectomicrobia bacterium]|uniref:HlyD family secretion protein n=1 Tax=Tectimicrobiota bacterium TaxID=2528274 RepID=A0A932MPC7_UNCTE|nr:HlyD family secretion protein [Candidatus Tectomicrobia bacterium]